MTLAAVGLKHLGEEAYKTLVILVAVLAEAVGDLRVELVERKSLQGHSPGSRQGSRCGSSSRCRR